MNRGNRHRRMYEMTGIPGWIRFGSAPGYTGRNFGRGICAQYIEKTGQMNDFLKDLYTNNSNWKNWQDTFQADPEATSKYQKEQLTQRINDLEDELKDLRVKLKNFR